MSVSRLLRIVWVLVLWAAAPPAAWASASTKVFPLSASRAMPAGLEGTPEALTNAVAAMVGGEVSDHSINGAALAAACTLDDSTCLDRIARVHRVDEIVFGTIRVGDDRRVFVKLTRFIAGTERRERTFVLRSGTPAALARQLARSAREMFELPPLSDEEPPPPARAPAALEEPEEVPAAAPAAPRGRVTRGTYFLISGGVAIMAGGTAFAIAAHTLSDAARNAPRDTPDERRRLAAFERAIRIRSAVGGVLLATGGLAIAGGVVRAVLQRRPIAADRALALVPAAGGAALVFSGTLP